LDEQPLEIPGKMVDLTTPSRVGRFGVTLAERNLTLLLLGMFAFILVAAIIDCLL